MSGQETTPLWPLAISFAAVLGLVGVMIGLSHVLGVALAYLWRIGVLDWGTSAVMRRLRAEGRLHPECRASSAGERKL